MNGIRFGFGGGSASAGRMASGVLAACLLGLGAMAQARVWYAAPGIADGDGTGDSWGDPVSLQTALTNAVADDEIWAEAGTYNPTSLNGMAGADPRDRHFLLKNGVAVYGGFAGTESALGERDFRANESILDGDLGVDGQVFHVLRQISPTVDATAVLDGFTVTNGLADGINDRNDGGGIIIVDSSPTIRNCTFAGNACAIAGSGSGGAIYIEGTLGFGAAPIIENCIFHGNQAGYDGGAVAIYNSILSPTVAGCLFYDNESVCGGAVGLYGISQNTSVTVVNCTLVDNVAAAGSAIATFDQATTTVANSIIRGASAILAGQRGAVRGVNVVTYSNVEGGHAGTGNIDLDPLFVDAGNNDFRLDPLSPSVNTGSNDAVPAYLTVDLDGDARIDEGTVDMGAYEYNPPVAMLTLTVVGKGGTLPAADVATEVLVGVPVAIEAIPDQGWTFTGWSIAAGNVTLDDADAVSTTVTLNDTSAATLTAGFAWYITAGMIFPVDADDVVGLPNAGSFRLKPAVYSVYTDPVKLVADKTAKAKVLTKVDKTIGVGAVDCEWTKKIKLFDSKAFKADQKAGDSALDWLNPAEGNQPESLVMDLRLVSKEAADQSLNDQALLVPPEIDNVVADVDADGKDILIITGRWFGTKKPKVWREYLDAKTGVAIKQQKYKVLAPDLTYTNAKGKPVCMEPTTGASRVVVQVPVKVPDGLNGTVVLDNGVGMAAVQLR